MSLFNIAAIIVAILHIGFFFLESVLWTSTNVRRIFGNSAEKAETTRVLAVNQGFYNLGAAALIIGFLATSNPSGVMGVLLYIVAMGVVGAATANWRILFVQSLPALIAFGLAFTA